MTRKLTDTEKTQWSEATKNVKRIARKAVAKKPVPKIEVEVVQQARRQKRYESLAIDPERVAPSKHAQTQKVTIDARIDLHGLSVLEAQDQLKRFLLSAQSRGKRWVLVITGKGSLSNDRSLRNLVPQWLDQWPLVTSYMTAKLSDGGEGALYVGVRRTADG